LPAASNSITGGAGEQQAASGLSAFSSLPSDHGRWMIQT
jgi:hypothetical protein